MNVYIFFLRGGTSIGALQRTVHMKGGTSPTQPLEVAKKPSTAPKIVLAEDPAFGHTVDVAVTDGQTIAQALAPVVGKRQSSALEAALSDELELASVRAGELMTLVYDEDDRLVALELRVSPTVAYRVDLGKKAAVSRIEGKFETRIAEVAIPAGISMWEGLHRSNENPALGQRIADVFLGDDTLTTAPAAERLRIVVEKRYVSGKFQRYGRILGADWVSRAGLRRAFSFGNAMYTERGESASRRYFVTPLRPAKVQGQHRVARGSNDARYTVDYTCAHDSVVRAIATGTVTAITRGKDGAIVTLTVEGGEKVVYSHLLRPSRVVALGDEVEQGRALGRTDGSITLEFHGDAARSARAFEESRVPSARLAALSAADRPRFGEAIAPVLERLRELAVRATDPLATRSLGAIP